MPTGSGYLAGPPGLHLTSHICQVETARGVLAGWVAYHLDRIQRCLGPRLKANSSVAQRDLKVIDRSGSGEGRSGPAGDRWSGWRHGATPAGGQKCQMRRPAVAKTAARIASAGISSRWRRRGRTQRFDSAECYPSAPTAVTV
jgi:hypothetical protein